MAASPTQAELLDPTALARFGKLDVVARLLVEGGMVGQHKSPFKGASIEFVEHRQYYMGDEIRHIDWRAFGKTGKYYVKEFEDETNLRCHLLVDASGSMGFGKRTLSKFAYAQQLAACLGYLLLRQRDAVGLTTFDTQLRERIDPSASLKGFQRMSAALQNSRPGGETALSGVIQKLLPALPRRSLVVLLSDCFDRLEDLTSALKQFRHARHEVMVFQIVAPEEEDFPFSKPTQFRSLEREGHRLLVDPHQLRRRYLEQYNAFCSELAGICSRNGVDHQKFVTTDPYQKVLGHFLDLRTRQKQSRRS